MDITNLFVHADLPNYSQFAKNEWIYLQSKPGTIDLNINAFKAPEPFDQIVYAFRKDNNALGYIYAVNSLFNAGIKSVKPTLEQCLVFENIELNIPFSDYKQPYETMLVEFPREYQTILEANYRRKPPIAAVCHRPNDKEYMIGGVAFGAKNHTITCFITNNNSIIEEMVNWNIDSDPDFIMSKYAERVAMNIMLHMTHFGHTKIGYENIKQHRFRVRKRPDLAKRDFFYVGLNQEIKLFNKKIVKSIPGTGTHASPICHWRRGFWKSQHYGPQNSLTKIIFIHATFVCGENYRGNMSDTSVTYNG